MTDANNLQLWESVQRTDSRYTTEGKKKGYTFTSIKPVYQFKQATKAFGINGISWGVEIGSEVFTHEQYGETTLLCYDAILFFKYNGDDGRIPIHAQEKASYRTNGNNSYVVVDEEARKKVVTNAMTKGLSTLGFSADIFMNLFDDVEYQEIVNAEIRLEEAEDFEKEHSKMFVEFQSWLKGQCDTIKLIPNSKSVELVVSKCEATLRDKLKVLKASSEKLEQSIKTLYVAGNFANAKIKQKIEDKAKQTNGENKNEK